MLEAYIVLGEVASTERKDMECIFNTIMPSDCDGDVFDFVREKTGCPFETFSVYPLLDFCEACNDQDIVNMDDFWMGYFFKATTK